MVLGNTRTVLFKTERRKTGGDIKYILVGVNFLQSKID